jgi:hypothetical protein
MTKTLPICALASLTIAGCTHHIRPGHATFAPYGVAPYEVVLQSSTAVSQVAVSEAAQLIATAGQTPGLLTFDGQLVRALPGPIAAVDFHPNGRTVPCAYGTGKLTDRAAELRTRSQPAHIHRRQNG